MRYTKEGERGRQRVLWVPACAVTFSAKLHLNMFDLCLGFVFVVFLGSKRRDAMRSICQIHEFVSKYSLLT